MLGRIKEKEGQMGKTCFTMNSSIFLSYNRGVVIHAFVWPKKEKVRCLTIRPKENGIVHRLEGM